MSTRTPPKNASTPKRPAAKKTAAKAATDPAGVELVKKPELPDGIPTVTTTGHRDITDADKKPFGIDGDLFHLIDPKEFLLSQAAASIDPSRPWTSGENYRALQRYTGFLLDYIEETPPDPDTNAPTGRALIMHRLSDPRDDLDLSHIVGVMVRLMEGWFDDDAERPTGSPHASA